MTTIWMVRAGRGGIFADAFIARNLVSVGWTEGGDLRAVSNTGEMVDRLLAAGLEEADAKQGASVLSRFFFKMSPGDPVLTYDPNRRVYHLGKIVGEADLLDQPLFDSANDGSYVYFRPVEWQREIARDDLSQSTRNSLGSISTLFRVRGTAADELLGNVPTEAVSESDTSDDAPDDVADLQARATQLIADRVSALSPDRMEELVAGLLRAMGYRARRSPVGKDRGLDILASRDGFGFETPRILAEVKHRPRTAIGAPDLRSFLSTLRDGDRGLYVSTGGFTQEAKYEADRAAYPVHLLTLEGLVDELVNRYTDLDLETRALMPLVLIYWPIT